MYFTFKGEYSYDYGITVTRSMYRVGAPYRHYITEVDGISGGSMDVHGYTSPVMYLDFVVEGEENVLKIMGWLQGKGKYTDSTYPGKYLIVDFQSEKDFEYIGDNLYKTNFSAYMDDPFWYKEDDKWEEPWGENYANGHGSLNVYNHESAGFGRKVMNVTEEVFEEGYSENIMRGTTDFAGFLFGSDNGNASHRKIEDSTLVLTPAYNGNMYWWNYYKQGAILKKGTTYTYSFEIRSDKPDTVRVYWYPSEKYTRWEVNTRNEWETYHFTYTQTGDDTIPERASKNLHGLHRLKQGNTYYIRNIRLVEGGPSKHYPSEEDMDESGGDVTKYERGYAKKIETKEYTEYVSRSDHVKLHWLSVYKKAVPQGREYYTEVRYDNLGDEVVISSNIRRFPPIPPRTKGALKEVSVGTGRADLQTQIITEFGNIARVRVSYLGVTEKLGEPSWDLNQYKHIVNEGTTTSQPLIRLIKKDDEIADVTINGVRFLYDFDGEDEVIIDCREQTAVNSKGVNRIHNLAIGHTFPYLEPGATPVISNTTIQFKKKDRWV